MTHSYVILGIPRSGKNSSQILRNRKTGARFVKKSKAASAWLTEAKVQLINQRGRRRILEGRLSIHADYYQRADVCDGDNMQSLLWDALKGVVVEDDKPFVEWSGKKHIDRERPRIEVTIRLLEAA